MAYEFYGSLMVYALAFLLATRPVLRRASDRHRRRGGRLRRGQSARCSPSSPASPWRRCCRDRGSACAAPARRRSRRRRRCSPAATRRARSAFYAPLTAIWPTWLPIPYLYAAAAAAADRHGGAAGAACADCCRGHGAARAASFHSRSISSTCRCLCSVGAYVFCLATRSAPAAIAAALVAALDRRDGARRLQPLVARQPQCRGRGAARAGCSAASCARSTRSLRLPP